MKDRPSNQPIDALSEQLGATIPEELVRVMTPNEMEFAKQRQAQMLQAVEPHLEIRANEDESESLDTDFTTHQEIREPYPYQMQCLQKLETARAEGKKQGLVVMATGTGKTAVAAFDVKQTIGEMENPRVLFVCHQSDILNRAQETFSEVLGRQYTYGFYDGKRKSDISSTNFMFATLQTLGRNLGKFNKDHFDYVVVDESHHSHADTYRPVVKYFEPGFMLGITATPDRADLQDIRELFGEEVYSLPLERALAQGLLSKIDYRVMSANIDSDRVTKLKQLQERDVTIQLLDRELFQPMALEEVVEKIQERLKEVENPHVMIFTPDVDECEKVAGMLEGAVAIHSKMNGERGKIVKALQKGEIDTAVSVDVFNEGIDIPRTNVLVFLRSTSSKTIFYQQLGRGLRKVEGKDQVLVLDFVGNCERIRMIQELAAGVRQEGGKLRVGGAHTRDRNEVDDIGDLNFEEISVDVLDLLGVAEVNRNRPGEGWFTARELQDVLGFGFYHITTTAERYLKEHPRWAQKRPAANGESTFYSPELIMAIKGILYTEKQLIDDNWATLNAIHRETGISKKQLNAYVVRFRETNPEWFREIRNRGRVFTLYSPDFVKKIESDLSHPKEWETIGALAARLDITYAAANKLAQKHGDSSPNWLYTNSERKGRTKTWVSPELVILIESDLKNSSTIEITPEGWLGINDTRVAVGRKIDTVREVITRFVAEDPSLARQFKNNKNVVRTYYSPVLIEKLKDYFKD